MANVDIRLGHKDTAWFTANPTLVLKDGQMVVCSDGGNIGKYKIGDGTTQLSALTFYGGADADLTSWASVTRASGFDTFVATPTSANLAALITDETGSGKVVFDTAPTFQTSVNAAYATASTIASFDGSKNLVSLATSTYPSLTELSYVKGVTSAIQTQLNNKYFTVTCTYALAAHTANTDYYFSSNHQLGRRTTAGQTLVGNAINATLIGASISAWNSGSTTSQTNSTLYFRLNGSDNTISSAVLWNTGSVSNAAINSAVSNLNVSVLSTDQYELKLSVGNLSTPPGFGNLTVTLYFRA